FSISLFVSRTDPPPTPPPPRPAPPPPPPRARPPRPPRAAGDQRLPHAVLTGLFTALEERRHAWFVLYDRTLPPGSELRLAAQRHREAIDGLAATGTAALLSGLGNEDPLDADTLKHVWTGTVSALMGWWIAHPDQSARDMSARCARLLGAVRGG
ncbi:hypothetical protein ACFXA3_33355, partial [Streptomyces sp. NPDC059456]